MVHRIAAPLVASLLSIWCAVGAAELPIIDAHSQVDQHLDMSRIIELMDEAGVSRTILAARGRVKPGQLAAFAIRHPDRITAAVRTKGRVYVENHPKYYKLLRKQLSMPAFTAMGEVLLWHAKKGNKAPEWIVPPRSQQVQAALAAALERRWPFIIHIEFAAAGGDRDPYMAQLEELLRQYPNHPFPLIHMGQLRAGEAERLIETFPNIYFLTSHANPLTVRKSSQPWVNTFDGDRLTSAWTALITQHPDRFILAFDNVFAEHWGPYYLDQVALWRRAARRLPSDVAHALAHGNAERLWRLPPVK